MLPTKRLLAYSIPAQMRERRRRRLAALLFAVPILAWNSLLANAQTAQKTSADDPTEIVWKMVAQNETRAHQLRYFTSCRHYHVEFHALGHAAAADMDVQATYNAGAGKAFRVINESGSHLLLNHVLRKLLETEQDDSREQKSALTPYNYNFTFDAPINRDGRLLYAFTVEPKKKSKLLYRGKIWIDADDFAVVKVEAEPAENPSFWIKGTQIQQVYAKSGEYWLPQTNRSTSTIRIGGTAVLTIDYGTYQFDEPQEAAPAGMAEMAAH